MPNRIETASIQHIHFHELNRICMRINHYVPPTILHGYRITLPLVYATLLAPGNPHKSQDFSQYPDSYGMYLCVDGSGSMISPEEWEMQPGSLIITLPNKGFQLKADSSGMLLFYFFFTINPDIPAIGRFPHAILPHFLQELAIMTEEYRQNIPGWAERASLRCSIMLSRICSLLGIVKPAPSSPYLTQFLINDVDGYLLAHLAIPVHIFDVAEYLGISQRTLMRHYQHLSGKTIHSRLLELRMEKSCILLGKTLLPLVDIAVQIGFDNVNYFGKAFRRHTGITPIAYRRKAFEDNI